MERRSSIDYPSETSHHNRVMRGSRPDLAAGKYCWGLCPKEEAKVGFAQAGQTSDNPISSQEDPKEAKDPFLSQTINEMKKTKKAQELVNYAKKISQSYRSFAPLEKIYNRLPLFSHYQRLLREQSGTLSVRELDFMLKDINASINLIRGIQSKYTLSDFINENYTLMTKALEDAKMVEKSRSLEPDAAPLIQRMEALYILTKEKFIRPLETFNLDVLSDLRENLCKEAISRLKNPEDFEKLYPSLFDITTYIGPPQDLLKRHEQKAEQHWREVYQHFYPNGFNGLREEAGYKVFIRALDDHAKNLVQDVNFFRHMQISEFEYLLANPDEKFPPRYSNENTKKKETLEKRGLKTKAFYNYPDDNMGPMHGYLSANENGAKEGIDEALKETYGTIRIRLKKEKLVGKSTVTFDDSWHYYHRETNEITIVPSPLVQPDRKVFPLGMHRAISALQKTLARRIEGGRREPIRAIKINVPLRNKELHRLAIQLFNSNIKRSDQEEQELIVELQNMLNKVKGEKKEDCLVNPLDIKSINDVQPYAEFQYHFADLTINDIDKVYLPMYDDKTKASIENIVSRLKSLNIEYEFYESIG